MNKLKYCIYIVTLLTILFVSCESEKKKQDIKPDARIYYNADSLYNDPDGYGQMKIKEIKKIISKLNKTDTTLITAYLNLGSCYVQRKDSNLYYFNKAIEVSRITKMPQSIYKNASRIVGLYKTLGLYKDAISLSYEFLGMAKELKDTLNITWHIFNLNQIYALTKEYNLELEYSKQQIFYAENYTNIKKGENKNQLYVYGLNCRGDAFLNLGLIDSALFYFQKSYQYSLSLDIINQVIPIVNLGEINSKINQENIAIPYYQSAIKILNENEPLDYESIIYVYNDIAKSYFKIKNYDSSAKYSNMAFRLAKIGSRIDGQLDASKVLYDIYKIQKKVDSIYLYQNIYYSLRDSILSAEKRVDINKKAAEEFAKENDKIESERKAEQERTKNLQLGLIAIFIPTFASAVYFISKKRNKNSKIITILGLASLLMLFEFISLLIHPYVERLTHHNPMMMYLILLIIASILLPLHHKLEGYVKSKL